MRCDISLDDFRKLLKTRRSGIKPLLLNQRFLRGMGNIYTDEALFEARIHPRAIAASLSKERAGRLHRAMVDILDHRHSAERLVDLRLRGCRRPTRQFSATTSGLRTRRRPLPYLRNADPPDRGGAARNALLSEVPAKLSI